ncbi:MAG: hypothetical protein WC022_02295 [Parcubacteria group bacterium]
MDIQERCKKEDVFLVCPDCDGSIPVYMYLDVSSEIRFRPLGKCSKCGVFFTEEVLSNLSNREEDVG